MKELIENITETGAIIISIDSEIEDAKGLLDSYGSVVPDGKYAKIKLQVLVKLLTFNSQVQSINIGLEEGLADIVSGFFQSDQRRGSA